MWSRPHRTLPRLSAFAPEGREVPDREGFEIEVTRKGKPLKNLHKNGVLGPYPFKRKLRDTKSVDEWKKERFEPTYPGLSCNV